MRNKSSFLPFLFLFSFIISCTSNKVSIVGKWGLVEVDTKDPGYNKMSGEDKKKELEKETVEFTSDGKFIALGPHDPQHGTYIYDEKAKSLTTLVEGKTETLSIELLEKNKMILRDKEDIITLKRD